MIDPGTRSTIGTIVYIYILIILMVGIVGILEIVIDAWQHKEWNLDIGLSVAALIVLVCGMYACFIVFGTLF